MKSPIPYPAKCVCGKVTSQEWAELIDRWKNNHGLYIGWKKDPGFIGVMFKGRACEVMK